MPAKKKKSKFSKKYGERLNNSIQAHAKDETKTGGFQKLPGGIKNGIAQLTECGFNEIENGDYKGEYAWEAVAVVVEPKEHDGINIYGEQTRQFIMMCDIKVQGKDDIPQDKQVERLLNHFRLLAGDDDYTAECVDGDDMEKLSDELNKTKPYFKFTTTDAKKKDGTPVVYENWNGSKGLEDYEEDDEELVMGGVKDETGDFDEFGDLSSLLKKANDDDDPDAQKELMKLAGKAGISKKKADATESWDELVELIKGESSEESGDDKDETNDDADDAVEVGNVYKFKPARSRKTYKVKVTEVDDDEEKAALKEVDGDKTWDEVPFDKLEE